MAVPYQTIMVPLDGSALSEQALPHAAALARQSHAELTLLRVAPPVSEEGIAGDVLPPDWSDLNEQQHTMVTEATNTLQELSINLKFQHIAVKTVVAVGQAADRIVDYAQAHDIDLIVMSTHGRTGVQRWLMGSVASKVMAAAPCPVLLVRARQKGGG
jgi:nucleotide-binding universal stress UspA family protein